VEQVGEQVFNKLCVSFNRTCEGDFLTCYTQGLEPCLHRL